MHLSLYQTSQRLYAVRHTTGSDGADECRVLKFDRTSPSVEVAEDPTPYTRPQMQRLLATIHAGNQQHGGLQMVCEACAIVGVVQLLEGPYLLLITRRRYLGAICGHKVYGIDATALLPILSPAAHRAAYGSQTASTAEQRYRKLLAGVQLTKDFFFSYTWPIHQTVQRTFSQPPAEEWAQGGAAAAEAFDTKFVWNDFLSRPLREALANARWVVPLAHGFFQQRPLALLGRPLLLTLVARRSRQFAGTRYLKRGVTDQGYAANDVEVEQVVEAGLDWKRGQPLLSSMVQVRGSIPLHWAQQPDSSVLKPEIVLNRFDPLYAATRRHFDQLREQYGEPICVLDLVKRVERRPRESVLGCEYATAIRFLNQRLAPSQQRVQYQAFDLSHRARAARTNLLAELQRLQEPVLAATGVFVSAPVPAEQRGVLRTNCIDSLDRTNVGQFTHGMLALGQQLHALGIAESSWLDPSSSLARHLMDAYEAMGHTLALQYGGSEAHTTFFQRQRGNWEATTQSRDLLTTVRRFYSNAYTDAEKQEGVNLFLGVFQPAPGKPHLWELGGDSYLHTARGRASGWAAAMGSRSTSFSAAAGPTDLAVTAADAVQGSAALASLPPPQLPAREPANERAASPPAVTEAEQAGLTESLSATSLVSLSSDGSYAPTLSALVEGAAQQIPRLDSGSTAALPATTAAGLPEPAVPSAFKDAAGEPSTPEEGSTLGAACSAAPAATKPQKQACRTPPLPPTRIARRSPLLSVGAGRKTAKLESFDQMLSRQPVAHVRLTATTPPAKPSALGWLSPSKQREAPAPPHPKGGPSGAGAASAALAAAGVQAAGPSIGIPRGSLQRSNSDPSLASSLGTLPLQAITAAGGGAAPRPRRVTFDGAATVVGPSPGAGDGPLVHQSSAPAATLSQLASAAAAHSLPAGNSAGSAFLVVEAPPDLSGGSSGTASLAGAGGMRRNMSYPSLGGATAEASSVQGAAATAAPPRLPGILKPPRRLSFPSLTRLRSLGRKAPSGRASADGGTTSSGGGAGGLPRSSSEADLALLHGAPSLLGPRSGLGAVSGAPEPLSMSAVVYGAEAVRRGLDSLGVAPAAASSWWLSGADPLAAMMEERQRLHDQIARQREALATPADPVEQRRLREECAALMRPSWALNLASFTQGSKPLAGPATPPVSQDAAAAAPVPQQGLVF